MIEAQAKVFYNKTMDKSAIKQLIGRLIAYRGSVYTAHILDQIKTLGFERSTQTGISLGIDDLLASPLKTWIIQDAEQEATLSQIYCRHGCIHAVERLRQIVETWHTTSEFLKREMTKSFNMLDSFNPVHMMSFSGARGNTSQVHQLVGMRGLMSDPQGNIIDLPIQNNLREGLSLTEYIISCYGARKGVVDTAIRTADAGYLTRRLIQVAQHVVIRNIDCNTPWGVYLRSIRGRQGNFYLKRETRLIGRVLARPVYIEKRCIAFRNQDIDGELANKLMAVKSENILVRSPLTCKNTHWACQLCYGWGGSYKKMVELGEAIGIIAGQSIGEPGTQLTLRTFHTGGVFTGDITSQIRSPLNGMVYFDSKLCRSTRNRHGRLSWKCVQDLSLVIYGASTEHILHIPAYSLLLINNNQYVESHQVIAEVRATVAPLKETVQRHIYSHLQGEVIHTKSAWHLSTALNKRCNINNLNTAHAWVWSGHMTEVQGDKIYSVYINEDYIETSTPLVKQNFVDSHQTILSKCMPVFVSALIGSFSYVKHKKTIYNGTIRFIFKKQTTSLCILLLCPFNQIQFKTTQNKGNIVFNSKLFEKQKHTLIYKNFRNDLRANTAHSYCSVLLKKTFPLLRKSRNILVKNNQYAPFSLGLIGQIKYSLQNNVCFFYNINNNLFPKTHIVENMCFYKNLLQKLSYWCLINENNIKYVISDFHKVLLNAQNTNSTYYFAFQSVNQLLQIGKILWHSVSFKTTKQLSEAVKVVCIYRHNIVVRFVYPFLLAAGAIIHVDCYDVIQEGDMLITLMYEQLKTSDIVQGLPKAEQLLEARSMNEIVLKLENDFLTLTEHIARQIPSLSKTYNVNTRNSIYHSQLELVNRIQTVYLSQGVRILDKHIEVIVRQISSKAMLMENEDPLAISSGGLICLPLPYMDAFQAQNWVEIPFQYAVDNYTFLPGELIELIRAQKMHYVLQNSTAHTPILLGITRASLASKSFLAEASFQRTARVLSKSALQGRVDWVQGLQENVLFGSIMPAGTGCHEVISELQFVNEVITEHWNPLTYKTFVNKIGFSFLAEKPNLKHQSIIQFHIQKDKPTLNHALILKLVNQSSQNQLKQYLI